RVARTRAATGNWCICIATSRKPDGSLTAAREAHLLMSLRIRVARDLLEPCEAKVSSTVLKGAAGGNTRCLPGEGSNAFLLPDRRGRATTRRVNYEARVPPGNRMSARRHLLRIGTRQEGPSAARGPCGGMGQRYQGGREALSAFRRLPKRRRLVNRGM